VLSFAAHPHGLKGPVSDERIAPNPFKPNAQARFLLLLVFNWGR
jgi:hypothetical protein